MRQICMAWVALLLAGNLETHAQAPGVPVIEERHGNAPELLQAAEALQSEGQLLSARSVRKQLQRHSCALALPVPETRKKEGRELWERARQAHLRIGYFYKCQKCSRWHLNLAGGYAITRDGAVATCYHVVEPGREMKEGYLVAATAEGKMLPVTEILAASKLTDACIVRVQTDPTVDPLPLNPAIHPGDDAWCYSDPAAPIRMHVSTDWAPGSSGAAVLDACGNAMGHVSEISSAEGGVAGQKPEERAVENPLIVFHTAVRAADVLALIQTP